MVWESPLYRIWLIPDLAVNAPVNKFDFSATVFASGFLNDGGILLFGRVATALRAATFELLQFCVGIGYYSFPLLPGSRTIWREGLIQAERFLRLIAVRGRTQLSCRASRKQEHKS